MAFSGRCGPSRDFYGAASRNFRESCVVSAKVTSSCEKFINYFSRNRLSVQFADSAAEVLFWQRLAATPRNADLSHGCFGPHFVAARRKGAREDRALSERSPNAFCSHRTMGAPQVLFSKGFTERRTMASRERAAVDRTRRTIRTERTTRTMSPHGYGPDNDRPG